MTQNQIITIGHYQQSTPEKCGTLLPRHSL